MSPTKIIQIDHESLSHAPDALPGGLKCAFSEKKTIKIGTGTTTKRQVINVYWYVEQIGPDQFAVWTLNANYVPTGARQVMTKDELLDRYHPELQYYSKNVYQAVTGMTSAVHRGDEYRRVSEFDEAEGQYNEALAFDEENVRAVFGLGLTHLQRRDNTKALHVFEDLIQLEAAFEPEHKHLFNEMGIALRKNKLYDKAVAFYRRALDFTKNDDHLYYNLSRACFEQGDWPGAVQNLRASLELNPELEEALDLAELILQMDGNKRLLAKHHKDAVPAGVKDQVTEILQDTQG